jgi:hypothetical protein
MPRGGPSGLLTTQYSLGRSIAGTAAHHPVSVTWIRLQGPSNLLFSYQSNIKTPAHALIVSHSVSVNRKLINRDRHSDVPNPGASVNGRCSVQIPTYTQTNRQLVLQR